MSVINRNKGSKLSNLQGVKHVIHAMFRPPVVSIAPVEVELVKLVERRQTAIFDVYHFTHVLYLHW